MKARPSALTVIVAVVVVGAGVGVWRAWAHGQAARAELAACMAGSQAPRGGTRLERVYRAAYVADTRRELGFPVHSVRGGSEGGMIEAPVERGDGWPFACSSAASELAADRWVRTFEPSLHAAASELDDALGQGFLPRKLDARLFELPSGRRPTTDSDALLAALDPVFDEDELQASRVGFASAGALFGAIEAEGEVDRVFLRTPGTGACVVEPSAGRALAAVRCGVPVPESKLSILNGESEPSRTRCAFPGGAVVGPSERAAMEDAPITIAFEDGATRSPPLKVERGAPAGDRATARWGRLSLTCTHDVARLTWTSTNVELERDVHALHRATCTRDGCRAEVVELTGLESDRLVRARSLVSPELVDLGDRAWLVWPRQASVAARVAPFVELGAAPTRTLFATYGADLGWPPFLGAIPISGYPSLVGARGDAALLTVNEGASRLDGTRSGSAFLVRLDASGEASLLAPAAP